MTLKEKYRMMRALGKDAIIYCDMDGVLARWEVGCPFEKTWEPNYFYNLELEPAVRDALLLLMDAGFHCEALSAAYETGTARPDKDRFLDKHGLEALPRLFVPCGENKANFIDIKEGMTYILLDDYNFNLISWKESEKNGSKFVPVKFLNGINGGSDTWKGRTIYHRSDAETIAHTLADLAVMS